MPQKVHILFEIHFAYSHSNCFPSVCFLHIFLVRLFTNSFQLIANAGFNRTEMTAKYKDIWDIEGAVEPKDGAKRVLWEVINSNLEKTGQFINCEDGKQIPW